MVYLKPDSDKLKQDINEFDIDNTDEDKVFRVHYFSAYKGKFVIITKFDASFSFGIIGLSHIQKNSVTLNHEYGHTQQLEYMGVIRYTTKVVIPSVTINILSRCGKLPYDYYGAPWEAEADRLGEVHRTSNNTPWPEGSYNSYFDLIKMFWD